MAFFLPLQGGGKPSPPGVFAIQSHSSYLEKLCNADVYLLLEVLLLCNCGCQFSLSIHFVFDGQLPAASWHTCIHESQACALHSICLEAMGGFAWKVCVLLLQVLSLHFWAIFTTCWPHEPAWVVDEYISQQNASRRREQNPYLAIFKGGSSSRPTSSASSAALYALRASSLSCLARESCSCCMRTSRHST